MLRRLHIAAACAALSVLCAPLGCAQKTEPPPGTVAAPACSCDPGPVVDPTLLAFLSKARAAHHKADLALEAGDRAGAIRALQQLVSGSAPAGALPEVAEVTADTRARLADLRSEEGDFDAALLDIEAGLALAREPSHFRGHLVEVRGLVEERRAKALAERGDHEAAARARTAAVAAFEEAIAIQDQVIAGALEGAKDKPR